MRNLPGGRVEATLEGERAAVESVLAWMAEGPPLAEVTRLQVTDEPPAGETDFRVH